MEGRRNRELGGVSREDEEGRRENFSNRGEG